MVRRMLLENTREFASKRKDPSPIIGFSCWGLGYLDRGYRQIGCMLHPAQNQGQDLRYMVGYGHKCRRETCWEALEFHELGTKEQEFWLHFSKGLDSFSYSSRKENPLFNIMGWGSELLGLIALKEKGKNFTWQGFFSAYPIFSTRIMPRANAYLLQRIVAEQGPGLLKEESFRIRFEAFSSHISNQLNRTSKTRADAKYTHLLGLDRRFLDVLRLSAGIKRINLKEAVVLKNIIDSAIEGFLLKDLILG